MKSKVQPKLLKNNGPLWVKYFFVNKKMCIFKNLEMFTAGLFIIYNWKATKCFLLILLAFGGEILRRMGNLFTFL